MVISPCLGFCVIHFLTATCSLAEKMQKKYKLSRVEKTLSSRVVPKKPDYGTEFKIFLVEINSAF